jgi:hypothetical protein
MESIASAAATFSTMYPKSAHHAPLSKQRPNAPPASVSSLIKVHQLAPTA